MEWIRSLFQQEKASLSDFKAAGCIFTDGNYVLAGYQQKADYNISGFGGKRLSTENYMQTALRETLEELFEKPPPAYLLRELEQKLAPLSVHINNSYILIRYSFKDLEIMLREFKKTCGSSPIYPEFPESLASLILDRIYKENSEIKQLCLLPLKADIVIHNGFKMDIALITKINAV
jgi:hypothetical protein